MTRTRHVGAGVPLSRLPNFSESTPQEQDAHVVIHGWRVFAHPLFLERFEDLIQQVAELRAKDPSGYAKKNAAKRYKAVTKLAFDVIPQDPARPEYRQGNTLGTENRFWFRAKFFQQYRLFFRFHAPSKTIVLGWVNDEATKRAYESDDDAYREGLWTIVTTGRNEKEFRTKYGAAVMRRLTHKGTGFVSMWEGEK